jgi:hypothetical protein
MATDNLAASRRAVILGLAGTAAFSGSIGAAIAAPTRQIDRRAWDKALAAFLSVEAENNAHPYGRTEVTHPDYDRLGEEQNEIMHRQMAAEEVLFLTPAPDAAALATKAAVYKRVGMLDGGDDGTLFDGIIADALRLAREG